MDVVVPQATEEVMRLYRASNWLWIIGNIWSLLFPFLFLVTGFSGRLATWTKRYGKYWILSLSLYLSLFILIYTLWNLPLTFCGSYLLSHHFGLSTETLGHWFANYGRSLLLTLVGALVLIWPFYLLLQRSPRRWWFYSGLVATGLVFLFQFITPIWINPLFNQFGPMQNQELEAQIRTLASRAGIEDVSIFEVDKSQETKMTNAYVTGIGSSRRIVLWDTTIEALSPDQLLFVVGHEMGHYVLHHVWWGIFCFSFFSFLVFYLVDRIGTRLLDRYRWRFGFSHLDNIASVPLFLLLISLFQLLLLPLFNAGSRYLEHEADRFGLELTQNNRAAAEAFVVLQQGSLRNPYPGPIYQCWRGSHPALGKRVEFANSYCP